MTQQHLTEIFTYLSRAGIQTRKFGKELEDYIEELKEVIKELEHQLTLWVVGH